MRNSPAPREDSISPITGDVPAKCLPRVARPVLFPRLFHDMAQISLDEISFLIEWPLVRLPLGQAPIPEAIMARTPGGPFTAPDHHADNLRRRPPGPRPPAAFRPPAPPPFPARPRRPPPP